MELDQRPRVEVPEGLLEAIRTFPAHREVEHCGVWSLVPSFAIYADCPQCGSRIKVRSFSAGGEIEDVFDAVFEWMDQPHAREEARRRQAVLREESEPADAPLDTSAPITPKQRVRVIDVGDD